MKRLGMVIDLKKCIGCHTCTIACKAENFTGPGIFWNKVSEEETGEYPAIRKFFLPGLCMHCQNAACIEVCPTGASYRREDGIVLIDYNKCAGCKYCIAACPYGARYFNKNKAGYFGKILTPAEELGFQEHKVGVTEKCTFCVHRIEKGEEPACVRACTGKARYFGDLNDPGSDVSRLIQSRHGLQMHKELNTNPSVYYLPL